MKFDLENKKVLITGASGGIGKELCQKFIDSGCKIICTSSTEDKLENLKKLFGNSNYYYHLDLLNKDLVKKNINIIAENHKDIDILINNAGLTNDNLLLRMKEDQWENVINVNLNSNFYIIKAILSNMIKNKSGNIIGITSIIAFSGNPGQANYAASKSGLTSMYKSIALEVAQRNIRVNTIAPGFIISPMTDTLNESQVNSIMEKIPMKKLGKPEDISNMALFLSSNLSSYITGQTLHINGGMMML